MDPAEGKITPSGTLGEGNGNNNEPDKSLEQTTPKARLSSEIAENGDKGATTTCTSTVTETSVKNLSTKPALLNRNPDQDIIHEDIQVKNVPAVQVGNNNIISSDRTDESQDSAVLGATASLTQSQNAGKVLVYRKVHIENCKYVQIGDNNRMVIGKVTPQEDAFVKACCELDIDPKTADDIREKLSREDVLEQFAKKMAETYSLTCRIRSARKGCILLELEVPTEADRLQLLRMARDGTFQQVLLETFLPELAAEGRAVNMNLAIGVRNPSQDMVEELQGAVGSNSNEDVVVVEIPATPHDPNATSKQNQPDPTEGGSSEQPDGQHEEDFAEGHKDVSAENQLPEVASSKPAPYTDDIPTLSKKLLPEAEDGEGEIAVSVEGYATTVPLGTGAAAAADFPPEGFDDKFLTCDICQNIYKDPRVTPCGHTFCARCLETWRKGKNEFTCPTCRKQVPLQETGVSSLPRNYLVNQMLEFRASQNVKEYPQCQMCEFGARIAGSCRDCHFFVCKSCIAAHSKAPALRHHLITLIRSSTEFCPKHANQPMAFYCQPCAELVCQDCIKTEHQQELHNPQEVSKVAQRIKDDLQTLVVKMRDMQKERDYILSKELICLRTKCELERKKIQDHFAQLRAKLDKEEQEMTNNLKEMEKRQQTSIENEKKTEGTSKSTEGLQFYDNIIARSSDVEIVALGYQLKDNLNHYLSTNPMQHTRAWHNQIEFVAEKHGSRVRELNQGILTWCNDNIMIQELPIESLPTTFIIDLVAYHYGDHEIPPKVAVTLLGESDTPSPDDMRYFGYNMDVPEDNLTRIDTARISRTVFEAAWRPQTSGKYMVGLVEGGQEFVNWHTFMSRNSTLIVDVGSNNPVLSFGQKGSQQGQFDRPKHVAVRGDRLYVADTGNKRVQVFDLSGNFCSSFPTNAEPAGLAVQTDGNIVVNCDEEVMKFSPSGEMLHKFPLSEYCTDPYGLAVQGDGRVVVADDDKHSIFLFEADGTLVKQVGGKGKGEGQFKDPGLVCVDEEDNIIVSDIQNDCIQVFDRNLVFQHKFGEDYDGDSDDDDGNNDDDDQLNTIPPQDMFGPIGVSADSRGNIVLANIGDNSGIGGVEHGKKLQVFHPDGTWVSTISSDGDKLNSPHGVAVTEDGHVFVTDSDDHCIRKYRYM